MIQQALNHYEFLMVQINNCDEKIKKQLLQQVAILRDGDISEIENLTVKKSNQEKIN